MGDGWTHASGADTASLGSTCGTRTRCRNGCRVRVVTAFTMVALLTLSLCPVLARFDTCTGGGWANAVTRFQAVVACGLCFPVPLLIGMTSPPSA